MSDSLKKKIILAIVLIYFISPVDAFPGPVDDIIVAVIGALFSAPLGGNAE
ncbi:MAG: hypothetical protein K6B41_00785 [Butyrivibrio sp.]|nr:hypothetical protein [Butyrivibrio sp.]